MEAFRKTMERRRRRSFWEATIAVCALITSIEERISFSTRLRVDRIFDQESLSSLFDAGKSVDLFDILVEEFKDNRELARTRTLKYLKNATNEGEEAREFVKFAQSLCDPASASYDAQVQMVEMLRKDLGVSADPRSSEHAKTFDADCSGDRPVLPADARTQEEPLTSGHGPASDAVSGTSAELDKDLLRERQDEMERNPSEPERKQSGSEVRTTGITMLKGEEIYVLFGRTREGHVDALRAYYERSHAEADRALATKLARSDCTIAAVPRLASKSAKPASAQASPQVHILCHEKTDSPMEGLRSYSVAQRAELDLKFVENISDDRFWITLVDLIGD